MCGIAGKVAVGQRVERALVENMCAAQVHRGPDSRGVHVDDGVALGIQRLRVIDLETGDQPIYSEDGSVVVVLNGEIYNYRELREKLASRGHIFATQSDTEVLVHLYEESGSDMIEQLHGMFAFALWDGRRRQLLLARDRIGKKPLYYAAGKGWLAFASELLALTVDPDVKRNLDPSSLDCYLTYGYIQAPYSIWRDVRKLPPGHLLVWSDDNHEIKPYWRLDYSRKISGDLPELEAQVRGQVGAAVRRRMVADVPLGAFLSGGVDSSIVVSEMAAASTAPVKTFSIGFDEARFNELPRARMVAEHLGTEHTEFMVRPNAVELLPKLVRHYGEPYADPSAIPTFYLAEVTRRQVTVALNGDGGDESFGGYRRYVANALTAWLDHVPLKARRVVARFSDRGMNGHDRGSSMEYARRLLASVAQDAPGRYVEHVSVFPPQGGVAILAPDLAAEVDPRRRAAVIRKPWESATGVSRLDRLLQVDVESYLPGDLLAKVDIASMAHSLEVRSPLLDHEVMELAASLPARYKARLTSKKWILRRAYRRQLPSEILNGPKKGFGVPLADWFRGDLRNWLVETLLDPSALTRDVIDQNAMRSIVNDHLTARVDRAAQIWALLCLEMWFREVATLQP